MTVALIVRCPPNQTLALVTAARAELGAGILWTPVVERRRRLPRSRKVVRYQVPLLSGYLFLHLSHARYLERLARRYELAVMRRADGEAATCTLEELRELREASRQAEASKHQRVETPRPKLGASVIIGHGPFKGLAGIITAIGQDHVTLDTHKLSGQLKICPSLLDPSSIIWG